MKARICYLFVLLYAVVPFASAGNWSGPADTIYTITQRVDLFLLISALWHIPVALGRRSVNPVVFALVVVPTFPVAAFHAFLVYGAISNPLEGGWNGRLSLFTLCVVLWLYHIGILTMSIKRGMVAARMSAEHDLKPHIPAERTETVPRVDPVDECDMSSPEAGWRSTSNTQTQARPSVDP